MRERKGTRQGGRVGEDLAYMRWLVKECQQLLAL